MSVKSSVRKHANDVFRDTKPRFGQPRRWVLLVFTVWKVETSLVQRDIDRLSLLLGRIEVKRAMHADRLITYVVTTDQSIELVLAEIGEEVRRMQDGLLDNYWIMPASEQFASGMPFDPLQHHVHEAWLAVRDHNNPPKRPTPQQIAQRHVPPGGDLSVAVRAGIRRQSE